MGERSDIQWTDATWTPLRVRVKDDASAIAEAKGYTSLVQIAAKMAGHVGPHCERISDGCGKGDQGGCYSEANNGRCLPSNGTGLPFDRRARDLVDPFVDEKILEQPLHWRSPKKIFCCSQTDLFGEWVPDEFIDQVFAVIGMCDGLTKWERFGGKVASAHAVQILTKRSARLLEYCISRSAEWAQTHFINMPGFALAGEWVKRGIDKAWLGVSAESQGTWDERTVLLEQVPAAVRFVSLEPQLEYVDVGPALKRGKIHWLIQGGESGPGARPLTPEWVRSVRDECQAASTKLFFKQWGQWSPIPKSSRSKYLDVPVGDGTHHRMFSVGTKQSGAILDGREWREFPEVRT